jgi:hypothetical protein
MPGSDLRSSWDAVLILADVERVVVADALAVGFSRSVN